ncbi:adenine phosphoribosyltransferase [Melioribacter roseus P3M-2]|uniref:Adenine phosphoribosyltransferase n=1 Tax=Melioribacter roseus (strain DSM 23840 / JCM 17771 / VKM B-2668 / P3M-2) TaxID=1191523 RepID=I6ZVG1_MELRP|nr:adenine phosphoribosyltransferase [Melioribacter roseus]AFN75989.1 adenine phosphoribosyltransferase [Melioribacter roseus P3M-2]
MDLKDYIRTVPDFPKKGIMFRDVTTLLKDGRALNYAVDRLYEISKDRGITKVVGIESRGFILGAALALKLNAGFVPVRKPGKLPAEKLAETYELEYGSDTIEIHKDAIQKGDIVLMHDDLLATGGTMEAACKLVEKLGGKIVQISFLIELSFLKGRDKLSGYEIHSLIDYDSE